MQWKGRKCKGKKRSVMERKSVMEREEVQGEEKSVMGGSVMGRKEVQGKRTVFILAAACILLLAGCGNQGNADKPAEVNLPALENDNRTEEPGNGISQTTKEESTVPESILDGQGNATITFTGTITENTIDITAAVILVKPMGNEIPYDTVFFELPEEEAEWALRIGSEVTIVCEDDFTESAPHFGKLISVTGTKEGESDVSLTAEQIEEAKQAAIAYYDGTVFSVNTIEYLEGKLPYGDVAGGCSFTVNVSKGGVVQEPNRTITLQPEQGGWKVVNEGY